MIDIILYAVLAVVLSLLIYRYGRFSNWRSTDAGRAFMLMKCSLFALVLYGLASVSFLEGPAQDTIRGAVVGSIVVATVYQLVVVVRRQGGWGLEEDVEPAIEQHEPMT